MQMREFFELSKNLLLLLVIFLIVAFVFQSVNFSTANNLQVKKQVGAKPDGQKLVNETALVARVIDGDTVIIDDGRSVRLLGLDADERGEKCFDSAKVRLQELVLKKSVVLESEPRNTDIYGRLLRYVFLDGQNIDLELVRNGLAVARAPYEGGKYDSEFVSAEEYARGNNIGCKWGASM